MRRLHLVSLPWTATTEEYLTCAYTQKVVKFCRMYEDDPDTHITLYASEENEAPCDEHVVLFTEAERHKWYGDWGAEALFDRVSWDGNDPSWLAFNRRAITELLARAEGDIVLLANGNPYMKVEQALRGVLDENVVVCEPFVGYEGVFTKYRAYESHTWRSHVAGLNQDRTGHWYDATIPNYFDRDEFPFLNRGDNDYLLYMGRVIHRKGVLEAIEVAKGAGMRLVVAGPAREWGPGWIQGDDIRIEYTALEYMGVLGAAERADVLANASALICPTLYVEPFGGVAVEAQMAGTPVLCTNWGAFTETVDHGRSGYRFATRQEGVDAVHSLDRLLDHDLIRNRAIVNYSLEAVKPQFDRWFGQLEGLWGPGWGALRDDAGVAGVSNGNA